jgi:putative PIN family toxin of toxin-antitoxin system
MRVVLDTNVLVAALLSPAGPPARVVEFVLTGQVEIAFDARTRTEYEDVLGRSEFQFPRDRVAAVLEVIDAFGFRAAGVRPWPERLPDAADEPFLAVAGATDSLLVTGNVRHYPARSRRQVVVCTPREFIGRLSRSSPTR